MSNTSLLLFFSLLPIVLILVIIYNLDRSKEPLILLLVFFVLGILSCFVVVEVSRLLAIVLPLMKKASSDLTFIEEIIYAFIGVALIEELCKWIVTYGIGYNNKEFDEIYDIIVYSVFMALGFAFFENILYIFNIGELKVAIFRAILAVPAHASYAIFMGYYLSMAKQEKIKGNKKNEFKYTILSILVPTILHGVYDYCLISNVTILIEIFVIFIIGLDILSIRKVKEMLLKNKSINIQ